jgi:hypothetical protein
MAESRMAGVEVRRRPSICDSCDRLRKRSNLEAESSLDKWIPYCEGFPDRVPREIYTGRFDHREPYPGDNGIRFQLGAGGERALRAYENSVRRKQEARERKGS